MGFKTFTCVVCGKEVTKPNSYTYRNGRACRDHQEVKEAFELKKEMKKREEVHEVIGKSIYEDLHRDPEANFMLNVSGLAHNMWYSISAAKTLFTKMKELSEIAKTDPMFYFGSVKGVFAEYDKASEIFADSKTYNHFLEKIDKLVKEYKLEVELMNSKSEEVLISFYKKVFQSALVDIEELNEEYELNSQEYVLFKELKTKIYMLMLMYSTFKGSKHAESSKCQEALAGEFERFKKLVYGMKKED